MLYTPIILESRGSIPAVNDGNVLMIAGPLLFGYSLVCALFGVLSYQVYIYYTSFQSDRFSLKCLVYGLYVLVFIQTIFNIYDAVWTFALDFGPIVASLVQMFYAQRIYILTGSSKKLIPYIIVGLSVFQFISSIATGVLAAIFTDLLDLSKHTYVEIVQAIWVVPSGICDITIAICMWRQVYNVRKTNVMRLTQALLLRIVKLVIGTGLMTAGVAGLSGIFFVIFPHGLIYGVFALSLGPLYANSMLVVLNNRVRFTETNEHGNVSSFQTSRSPITSQNQPGDGGAKLPPRGIESTYEVYNMSAMKQDV